MNVAYRYANWTDYSVWEFCLQSNFIEGVEDEQSLLDAVRAWDYIKDIQTITPEIVCELHRRLMKNQPLQPEEIGAFRKVPVWVGSREAIPYHHIQSAINAWCINTNYQIRAIKEGRGKRAHWKQNHVRYEKIHPFVDGNGRTGRMLLNWERLRLGLTKMVIIPHRTKRYYYRWFAE